MRHTPRHFRSKRPLHPAFVVTVSTLSLSAACGTKTSGPDEAGGGVTAQHPVANPPPTGSFEPERVNPPPVPEIEMSDDPEAFRVRTPEGAIDWSAYTREVNARTNERKMVFRAAQSCYVHGEMTEAPRSWVPPPREEVACPPIMRAPHWTHCQGGRLMANVAGDSCLCAMDGNPPPPPHLQDCPKD